MLDQEIIELIIMFIYFMLIKENKNVKLFDKKI